MGLLLAILGSRFFNLYLRLSGSRLLLSSSSALLLGYCCVTRVLMTPVCVRCSGMYITSDREQKYYLDFLLLSGSRYSRSSSGNKKLIPRQGIILNLSDLPFARFFIASPYRLLGALLIFLTQIFERSFLQEYNLQNDQVHEHVLCGASKRCRREDKSLPTICFASLLLYMRSGQTDSQVASRRKFVKPELVYGFVVGGQTDSQVGAQVHASRKKQ